MLQPEKQALLRKLPGIDHLLEQAGRDPQLVGTPRSVVGRCARQVVEQVRDEILKDPPEAGMRVPSDADFIFRVRSLALAAAAPVLQRTVNATGVVIHTNLGRSLLASAAIENLERIGGRYSNLEFDLQAGARGSRYSLVEGILCEITGAEAALVVNNNAGAVFLCLETIARNREVIVSRGELVEIGGSFRIPDVMARSGARLREVGTTNRTHLRDYEQAVGERTGLLLKVHTSNYRVVGFTAAVTNAELVKLGQGCGVPVMEDLGSGTFIDFSQHGLLKEPTVQEAVAAGLDIVTFSGDKLLGGPQAGIILGRRSFLDLIKKNPLNRVLRIDKLTLAALESTLRLYRDPHLALEQIPTLRMLTLPTAEVEQRARRLAAMLAALDPGRLRVAVLERSSRAGGGSLPMLELPSRCVAVGIDGISSNALEAMLRGDCPPILGRIEEDALLMDVRTVQEDELPLVRDAFQRILEKA